jgi:hypothetical protein
MHCSQVVQLRHRDSSGNRRDGSVRAVEIKPELWTTNLGETGARRRVATCRLQLRRQEVRSGYDQDARLRAVKPLRAQWNAGYGADSGPSQTDRRLARLVHDRQRATRSGRSSVMVSGWALTSRAVRSVVLQPVWSKCRCVQKTWVISSSRRPAAWRLSSYGCVGKS